MSDSSFEVAQSSSEDGLSVEQQHEVVAAQLRGEAKAAGQPPEAVVASVAAELEEIGLEPDASELHRRYEEIDPEIPELTDEGDDRDLPPADAGTGATSAAEPAGADGPVAAGVDASSTVHQPVQDAPGGEADPHAR
jgi:hypothetical protein